VFVLGNYERKIKMKRGVGDDKIEELDVFCRKREMACRRGRR
jgi:hypothetical protein